MATEVKSAPGVPHAPGAPKGASCSHTCIELEWEAPLHDGGSGVASYRLEMSSGEISALDCNVQSLLASRCRPHTRLTLMQQKSASCNRLQPFASCITLQLCMHPVLQ